MEALFTLMKVDPFHRHRILLLSLICFSLLGGYRLNTQGADLCDPPLANPIPCENAKPGTPPTEWDLDGTADASILGFATEFSVNLGETVRFKVDTTASSYRIDIYRIGYYQGLGARLIASVNPSVPLPQTQPTPLFEPSTGLVDCGNWAESASWAVPTNAVSGLYIGKLVRADTGGASHIYFVVRDDSRGADILFQTSDTTWQAYNGYGGRNFYDFLGTSNPRAYKVSYNRPFITRDVIQWASLFTAEYPMIRWLEANGFDVSYSSGIDTDRRGAELLEHKVFLSVGHDEYWAGGQRANVEAARNAGVHLAFFSGNEIFWKVRWEPAIDGSGTPYRTLVCYKETKAHAKIDPHVSWTGTWRDPRFSPPSDGGRPENALSGTLFAVNGPVLNALEVPADYGKHRFWRNTSVASLAPGQVAVFSEGILGFEWDQIADNGFQPPGQMRLSRTITNGVPVLQDHGNAYASGEAAHSLSLYRHASGALVFGAGTIHWSWGLDGAHDNAFYGGPPDLRIQQATVNLFADMEVQPVTLQAGLVPAVASTDTSAPTSSITAPAAGASLPPGVLVLIAGNASDVGGQVGGVEVSIDGGATWHAAEGRSNWTYAWTPATPGTFVIKSRAVDDSGNLESPSPGVSLSVAAGQITIWPSSTSPGLLDAGEDSPIQLGVKFRSELGGTIEGIRFYKSAANTGPHVGNLWTTNGTLLATVTFVGETTSGWQQMNFATPVAITANTHYVASYHCPRGHYSKDVNYFLAGGVDNPPLHALANSEPGGNGVFAYGPSNVFPSQTFGAANYGVDVAFQTPTAVITAVLPNGTLDTSYSTVLTAIGGSQPYHWSLSSGSLPPGLTINSTAGTISGTPTTTGVFNFTVQVSDSSDPAQTGTKSLSITIYAGPPLSIWPSSSVPGVVDGGADNPVELGVKFRPDVDGAITGIRFYKAPANVGTHVANLWNAEGSLLASATFANETASGWQQTDFANPVPITANSVYVASYHCNLGHYSIDLNYFAADGAENPPLNALPDGVSLGNGVYAYGATSAFPTNTYRAANYWVDVAFQTPLAITTASLSSGVLDTSYSITLTARSGRGPYTWTVFGGSLPPGLVLNSATGTIAGTPTTTGTYNFTAQVSDLSNPVQTAEKSFSIRIYSGAPLSIWSSLASPGFEGGPDSPLELGVKFRSHVSGMITGVRFYKLAGNTGSHSGSLWSSTGTLLASAPFVNESVSGWQQVDFVNPVSIAANTVYVASYHCKKGHYGIDMNYFANVGDQFPLEALSNDDAGGNGVYAYSTSSVFPNQSFGAANYWVDVAFQTPLAISNTFLPNGVVGKSYSATLNASSGKPQYSWSISSGSLPDGLTLDTASGAIFGTPTTPGPFSFTAQVSDSSNPIQSATKSYNVTISSQVKTLWSDATLPAVVDAGADSPVQLGVKFRSEVSGTITGIRFYKSAANIGTHVGNLWSASGVLLASAVFTGETASGWQTVQFATPVTISANSTYVASYHCEAGHYSLDSQFFAAEGATNPPLYAPASDMVGGNGVYGYGSSSTFPNNTYRSANYWIDVLFLPDLAP